MNWHAKKSDSGQGMVIDVDTGRTVAVAYNAKDADMLAAAPELYDAARAVLDAWQGGDLAAAVRGLQSAVDKAEGKE